MNIQPVFTRYDINRKIPLDRSSPIVVDHVEDYETRFIEVYVYESVYNKQVDLKGTTITARIVAALSTEKILLNDNVVCTLNGSGNIIIPIDGAVIETLASVLLIEVRITQDTQALVLPFPLYVQMRGSILDDAGVAPESRGTIPELLEAAIAALEEAKNYENLENKPEINGHTLSGDKTSDDLGLQKKLTAGQNITIESDGTISAEGGGVTSYNDLTDKPKFQIQDTNGTISNITIENVIKMFPFYNNSLTGYIKVDDSRYYKTDGLNTYSARDFDTLLYEAFVNNSVRLYNINSEGIPHSINAKDNAFVLYQISVKKYFSAQLIFWVDATTSKSKAAYRICEFNHNTQMYNITDFVEFGSSQIVSGVVNQNGTITFTDSDGNTFTTTGASVIGPQGVPGQDYVLTEQDKSDIADIVLGELPTTEGVLYGNTSN